jgi:hypothetical protein
MADVPGGGVAAAEGALAEVDPMALERLEP